MRVVVRVYLKFSDEFFAVDNYPSPCYTCISVLRFARMTNRAKMPVVTFPEDIIALVTITALAVLTATTLRGQTRSLVADEMKALRAKVIELESANRFLVNELTERLDILTRENARLSTAVNMLQHDVRVLQDKNEALTHENKTLSHIIQSKGVGQ